MVSSPMETEPTLIDRFHDLRRGGAAHAVALRYILVGGFTASVYLGLGVLLSGPVGMNIQLAIPIAYVTSIALHFTFQRYFVWAHKEEYALDAGGQGKRYLIVAFLQYVITALATAFLPAALGVSQQIVFLVGAVVSTLIVFTVLRLHVFHGV